MPTPPLARWHVAYACPPVSCMLRKQPFSPAAGNIFGILSSLLGPAAILLPQHHDAVRRELHYNLIKHHMSFGRRYDQPINHPTPEIRQCSAQNVNTREQGTTRVTIRASYCGYSGHGQLFCYESPSDTKRERDDTLAYGCSNVLCLPCAPRK